MNNERKRGLNDLLIRIGQGDYLALNWIYELLREDAIHMLLAEIGGMDAAEADALYNRAMHKIWLSASGYESRSSGDVDVTAYAWLRKIIINTARDWARVARKHATSELQEADMISEGEDETQVELSPIEQLQDDDLALHERETNNPLRLLESKLDWAAFLASLDERELLICTRLAEGKTQTQIAAELDISPARLSQIVKELRQRADAIRSA